MRCAGSTSRRRPWIAEWPIIQHRCRNVLRADDGHLNPLIAMADGERFCKTHRGVIGRGIDRVTLIQQVGSRRHLQKITAAALDQARKNCPCSITREPSHELPSKLAILHCRRRPLNRAHRDKFPHWNKKDQSGQNAPRSGLPGFVCPPRSQHHKQSPVLEFDLQSAAPFLPHDRQRPPSPRPRKSVPTRPCRFHWRRR